MFSTWFNITIFCLTIIRSFCSPYNFIIWIINRRIITTTLWRWRASIILVAIFYHSIIGWSEKTPIPFGFLGTCIWVVIGIIMIIPVIMWMPPIMIISVTIVIIIRITIVGSRPWIISPIHTTTRILIHCTIRTIIIINIFMGNYGRINFFMNG